VQILPVYETNPVGPNYHDSINRDEEIYWTDKRLQKIVRVRLLSDPGLPFWDISYCHGRLSDGRLVPVCLPFHQLPKKGLFRSIVNHAKKDNVYAKGLGFFSDLIYSKLC